MTAAYERRTGPGNDDYSPVYSAARPLFQEVREALYAYRGNLARLVQTVMARSFLVTMTEARHSATGCFTRRHRTALNRHC